MKFFNFEAVATAVKSPWSQLTKMQWLFILLVFIALSFGDIANAVEPTAAGFKVLDRVDAAFKPFQTQWYTAIKVYAIRLFWSLASVDFAWSAIVWAMEKNDIGEVLMALVRKIFSLGFFWTLLKMSDTWIPAIISSLTMIGQEVGGLKATPDGVIYAGFYIALGAFKIVGDTNLTNTVSLALPVLALGLGILVAFIWVAKELLTTLIESYLQIGAGVILLGFGGSRWTTDFATKYIQSAFGTGLKLMMIYLVIGVGNQLVNNLAIDTNNVIESMLGIFVVAIFYAGLATKIPALASAMMSGSPALSAGGMMGAAIGMGAAVAGAATGGAALAAGAAGAATGGAAGAAGLAQALGAGMASAGDMGKKGGDAALHAAGEVAKQGLGMGVSAIGSAMSNAGSSFSDKVANSTGGQIASSIEAGRGGSLSGAASAPSGDAAAGSAPAEAAPDQGGGAGGGESSAGAAATEGGVGGSPAGSGGASSAATAASAGSGSSGASSAPSSSSSGSSSASAASGSGVGSTGSASKSAPAAAAPSGGSGSGSSPAADAGAASGSTSPSSGATGGATPSGGDAADASVSGGSQPSDAGSNEKKLHEKVKDLGGYVPQDAAPGTAININMGHAKD